MIRNHMWQKLDILNIMNCVKAYLLHMYINIYLIISRLEHISWRWYSHLVITSWHGQTFHITGVLLEIWNAMMLMWHHCYTWETTNYRKISNIRNTKSQNFNVSRLSLQLSLHNILKPSVKWRMKMQLEQCRHAMLQLHLNDQQFDCLLKCV